MTRAVVTYDTFDGGEWGTLGPRRARPGMFSGPNVRVYKDGSIGPRPGMKELVVTGMPAGDARGLCYRPIGSSELLVIVNDHVYVGAMATTPILSFVDDLAVYPDRIVRFNEAARKINDTYTYFAVVGQQVYAVGYYLGSLVLGAITGTPAGNDVELYRSRMIGGSATQQVFYSDAADFGTWDALNYFDVGFDYPASRMVAHRDGLSIFTASPIYGGGAGIWRVTGTLGVSDVLRRASNALPIHETGDVALDGDTAIYTPAARSAPVTWDGGIADERSLAHLEWYDFTAATIYAAAVSPLSRDVLIVADSPTGPDAARGLLRSNGVWSYITPGAVNLSAAMSRFEADKFMALTNDSTPRIMVLDTSIQRPGFTSDDYAQPGDDSTTPVVALFSLPEWWDHEGREVRVRSVIVNATKWRTGAAAANNITLAVTALDRFGPSAAVGSATQSWNEAGTSATTDGTDFRWIANFGDQGSGGGYQLAFSALKGVSIRDIAVVLDISETRAA